MRVRQISSLVDDRACQRFLSLLAKICYRILILLWRHSTMSKPLSKVLVWTCRCGRQHVYTTHILCSRYVCIPLAITKTIFLFKKKNTWHSIEERIISLFLWKYLYFLIRFCLFVRFLSSATNFVYVSFCTLRRSTSSFSIARSIRCWIYLYYPELYKELIHTYRGSIFTDLNSV